MKNLRYTVILIISLVSIDTSGMSTEPVQAKKWEVVDLNPVEPIIRNGFVWKIYPGQKTPPLPSATPLDPYVRAPDFAKDVIAPSCAIIVASLAVYLGVKMYKFLQSKTQSEQTNNPKTSMKENIL